MKLDERADRTLHAHSNRAPLPVRALIRSTPQLLRAALPAVTTASASASSHRSRAGNAESRPVQNLGGFPFGQPCEFSSHPFTFLPSQNARSAYRSAIYLDSGDNEKSIDRHNNHLVSVQDPTCVNENRFAGGSCVDPFLLGLSTLLGPLIAHIVELHYLSVLKLDGKLRRTLSLSGSKIALAP